MRLLTTCVLVFLLAGCSKVSPNLAAYYEVQKHHDQQQAIQAATTVKAIRSTTPARGFATQAEASMFAVVQAMLIERVKYTRLDVAAPRTGYDYLSSVTLPILQLANPWLLWLATDNDDGTSKSGNSIYNVEGDGDLLVNSSNSGSQNSGSVVSSRDYTSNFKTTSTCTTGDCEEDDGAEINPVITDPGYVCAEGEMYTTTCSCKSYQAGLCQ